ncbi:L,D-transpeptidase [Caproiciproducens sp. MSJ-32]|uniref:L,D-transpeptidase n=1 Tax=Caproiciproducens sp. MSJ-32 TaxID=2841527 RepID=UPI001C10FF13|nr:L,D-transpeptidase [Caproiciproducens sp. MSJ-32]MBU5455511.1 L,D-transpeptidase [Caproiciproducens sp. MSJ-32]
MFGNKKRKNNFSIFKLLTITFSFFLLIFTGNLFLNYKYDKTISEFYLLFNNYEFEKAKDRLENDIFIKLKSNKLQDDLNSYFTKVIAIICGALKNEEISKNQATILLNEIKEYNVLSSSLDKLIAALNPESIKTNSNSNSKEDIERTKRYLELGINCYNSEDYPKAFEYFNLVLNSTNSEDEISIASDYIERSKNEYKNYLLKEADELAANKFYTRAIEILSQYDTNLLEENDVDILNKINSFELFREEYNSDSDIYASSNAILETITEDNINTLSISSNTNNLIYLNLAEQKTYIYEGSTDNWTLIKTFISSTGLEGKETPKGVFAVINRGEWFFSPEFNQGGKYWVQFMGDYLFHSVPFDESATTIVDNTLGKPASHGCIRLSVDDAKWIYDNIPNGTKIIIN